MTEWERLRPLARRINAELADCHALVTQDVAPIAGPVCIWIVCGIRQAFIADWPEAQAFAGQVVQRSLFD